MKIWTKIIVLLLFLFPLSMRAQLLNVIEDLHEDVGNLYAVQNQILDKNQEICGVIFLGLIYEDVTFEGDIIKAEFSEGEWRIYMPQGSNWLNIKSKSNRFTPLRYEFPENIKGKLVYVMTIVLQDIVAPITQQYLAFQIEPANATLEVDGQLWSIDAEGSAMRYVDFGSYIYTVRASDYFAETGRVTVNDPDNTKVVTVKLKPNFANVTLAVNADAEIWVNGQRKGNRTWTGLLGSGTYKVECKQPNCETSVTSVEITSDMNGQTFTLPAPKPVYGSLMVESTPNFCKLFIDGKESGTTPKSVNEIQIGQHELRLTKDGYTDYLATVTITKGERKQVQATLEKPQPIVQEPKPNEQQPKPAEQQPKQSAEQKPKLTEQPPKPQIVQEPKKPAEQVSDKPTTPIAANDDLTFTVSGVSFTMKFVEGDKFHMGAQRNKPKGKNYDSQALLSESPVHSVKVSSFYMGETEVTQALWMAVMGTNPSYYKGDDNPALVSWDDCQRFLRKLNSLTGKSFRLPTEAEWEYAARGGKKSNGYKYAGSNNLDEVAYGDNSGRSIHPVGGKKPNELGFYDMSGNAYEWCSDWYDCDYYMKSPSNNPQGPSLGTQRVRRGDGRVSHRDYSWPDGTHCFSDGFRLVLPQ